MVRFGQAPTDRQELVDAIGEQVGRLHRHVVPGADFDVAGAGNGFGHAFRQRRRAHAVETAADHEDRTSQPGEFVLHVGCRQHSPDRGIARGIVAEPSRPEALEPGDVAAKLRGIAVQHRILDRERHAGGFDPCEALQRRRAALRCDAGGRAADRNGAGALRIAGREVQGDRTADGDPRKRDLAGDRQNDRAGLRCRRPSYRG